MRVVKDGEQPPSRPPPTGPKPPRRSQGPVERATRRSLRALRAHADQDVYDALAAGAVVLARTLDDGAGLAAAAVHRELRITLDSLRPKEVGVDAELAALMDNVRDAGKAAAAAQMGHPTD